MPDSHYREIERVGVEPIEAMETAVLAGIPAPHHATVLRNLSIAMAVKYLLRCGSKDTPEEELRKAENYIHRAMTGRWKPADE